MTIKWMTRCTLMLAVVSTGIIRAQEMSRLPAVGATPMPAYSNQPNGPSSGSYYNAPGEGQPTVEAAYVPHGLSHWISGDRPGCCGPIGGHGSIKTELFFRTGPSLIVGGGILKDVLDHGYVVEAGGRSMFFNLEETKAWTIDLSVSNTWNHGKRNHIPIPYDVVLPIPNPINPAQSLGLTTARIPVTVREMNRTSGNLLLGREWYAGGPANIPESNWRYGADMSARLGTLKLELHELSHRTDNFWGFGLGVHTDAEIPCGCCVFQAGLRLEWNYNWIDAVQPQNAQDLQEVNLLLRLGMRF